MRHHDQELAKGEGDSKYKYEYCYEARREAFIVS